MLTLSCFLLPLLALSTQPLGVTSHALPIQRRAGNDSYAPYLVSCPRRDLVREARGINVQEARYVSRRRQKADAALEAWVKKAWRVDCIDACDLPVLALAHSGGGSKAGMTTAGVTYAFDARDSNTSVSGLLQSLTYISALSGGTLTLGGIMANNFSRVSTLRNPLWDANFQDPFSLPISQASVITAQINGKTAAGYTTTLIDVYGRALAYDYIGGPEGAAGKTWSSTVQQSAFQKHLSPFPIITATDAKILQGQCSPRLESPIWEFSPYEFGSWDPAVHALVPTEYLGSTLQNGRPQNRSQCTKGFDNTGLIMGISSNILVGGSSPNCSQNVGSLGQTIQSVFPTAASVQSPYGIVPNPFYRSRKAGTISNQSDLYMTDGGNSQQGVPINPWLQPERDVDVIFAIDATSTGANNITIGGGVSLTYAAAIRLGLTRMPPVPDFGTFLANNYSSAAQFYGCHNSTSATVIYIPNTYSGAVSGAPFFFTAEQRDYLINSGVKMATQNGDEEWPACLACAIMHKKYQNLPDVCGPCLQKYCWAPSS